MRALTSLFLSALFITSTSSATYETEDEIGFETIVSELSQNQNTTRIQRPSGDLLNDVKIHSGVGFTQSFIRVDSSSNGELRGFHRGVQATLGIDLFSRNWFAEGAIRSFGETDVEESRVRLREFDLKVAYRSNSESLFGYRAGIGLAARNLKLIENGSEQSFSTPASIALLGIDANISRKLSIGTEVSYRAALVSESADRSAFDFAFKVDAHF